MLSLTRHSWKIWIKAMFCLSGALLWGAESLKAEEGYLPIVDGGEWIMDFTAVSPSGEKIKATAHRKIGPKIDREGKTYWRSHTWVEGTKSFQMDYTLLVRKDDHGFHTIHEQSPVATEQLQIPLPLKVGQTWETESKPAKFTNRVVGKETVTIGSRTYPDCFHIQVKSETKAYTEDIWEAPGFGTVKSEIKASGGTISLTLREFKGPASK